MTDEIMEQLHLDHEINRRMKMWNRKTRASFQMSLEQSPSLPSLTLEQCTAWIIGNMETEQKQEKHDDFRLCTEIDEKQLFENIVGKEHTKTSKTETCRRCGSATMGHRSMQIRSGDEGESHWIKCSNPACPGFKTPWRIS